MALTCYSIYIGCIFIILYISGYSIYYLPLCSISGVVKSLCIFGNNHIRSYGPYSCHSFYPFTHRNKGQRTEGKKLILFFQISFNIVILGQSFFIYSFNGGQSFFIYSFNGSSLSNLLKKQIKMKNSILFYFSSKSISHNSHSKTSLNSFLLVSLFQGMTILMTPFI